MLTVFVFYVFERTQAGTLKTTAPTGRHNTGRNARFFAPGFCVCTLPDFLYSTMYKMQDGTPAFFFFIFERTQAGPLPKKGCPRAHIFRLVFSVLLMKMSRFGEHFWFNLSDIWGVGAAKDKFGRPRALPDPTENALSDLTFSPVFINIFPRGARFLRVFDVSAFRFLVIL